MDLEMRKEKPEVDSIGN